MKDLVLSSDQLLRVLNQRADPLSSHQGTWQVKGCTVQENAAPSYVSHVSYWWRGDQGNSWTHGILQMGRWEWHSTCPMVSPSRKEVTMYHARPPGLLGNAGWPGLWEEDFWHQRGRWRPVPVIDSPEWFYRWHWTEFHHSWVHRNWEGGLFDQRTTSVGTEWGGNAALCLQIQKQPGNS